MKSAPAFSLRRRRILVAGTAGLVTLATAGIWSFRYSESHRADWIADVIRRNLPGVRLDEASLKAFCQAGSNRDGQFFGSAGRRWGVMLDQAVPALLSRVPQVDMALEKLERAIVSEYLLGSNFFQVADVMSETIIHAGRSPACGNPFAVFKP